jgi:iron-sulfur cluster repair protein YtfE (RIC family)
VEIGQYIADLATLQQNVRLQNLKALQRVLYALYALVKVHFSKEEEVYLPILEERLTEEEARGMFEAMEHAAGHAKEAARAV